MTAAEVVIEITRQQRHHLVHIAIEEHPQPRLQQELERHINRRRRCQQHRNLQVLSLSIIRRHQNVDAPLQSPIRLLMMEAVIAARKNNIP